MEGYLPITQRARYFASAEPSSEVRQVWIVLHGYGQQARFFLRKFNAFHSPQRLFVAPEAMHRFYLTGNSGRVGASWMTREDRETDIANYITYLNELRGHMDQRLDNVRWNVLGFSQGAATAVRWVTASDDGFDNLVLWAGSFPPDIDLQRGRQRLNNLDLRVVVGNKDEFLDAGRVQSARQWLDDRGIAYAFNEFEGRHDIPPEALTRLYSQWVAE